MLQCFKDRIKRPVKLKADSPSNCTRMQTNKKQIKGPDSRSHWLVGVAIMKIRQVSSAAYLDGGCHEGSGKLNRTESQIQNKANCSREKVVCFIYLYVSVPLQRPGSQANWTIGSLLFLPRSFAQYSLFIYQVIFYVVSRWKLNDDTLRYSFHIHNSGVHVSCKVT